jgi:hypothetical protein
VDFFPGNRQKFTLKEQIRNVALFVGRSVNTVERWASVGCDVFDVDSVMEFYRWNSLRAKNKKPYKRRRLRARSPLN